MRAASRFAIIGVVGGLAAGCSTDRFASNAALANPFAASKPTKADPVRTGSINPDSDEPTGPRSMAAARPASPIHSTPIAPPTYSPAPAPTAAMPSRPRTASGTAGWSTTGGTTVIVGPGETLSTLTSRYGVPGEAILSANGMKAGDVAAGRRVVIPVYSARQDAEPAPARRVEAAPVRHAAPAAPAPARVVATQKIDVKKAPPRSVAEAAPPKTQLRPGQTVAKAPEPVRPAPRVVEAKRPVPVAPAKVVAKAEPKPVKVEPAKVAKVEPKAAKPEPVKTAKLEPKKDVVLPVKKADTKVAKVEAAPKPEPAPKVAAAVPPKAEPAKAPVREPETTASIAPAAPVQSSGGGSSDFRWPARGRVISGFNAGGGNEGINIAVPEGTPVKAAGDGVVAYAGSEVKGYGNLVLIRHDNGYVSAYANNGQIDVKRGQRVNRGQAIAKSGQTGNVTSPQLHFEIRKGSTPVDPMKYLASAE